MRRFAIAFIIVSLIAFGYLTNLPVAATTDENFLLITEYTLEYTIIVRWSGHPFRDSLLHIEFRDIPISTAHQQVEAQLEEGYIENTDGGTWIIENYILDMPETFSFTGMFSVRVNIENTPPVQHQPITPASGMENYLGPDDYVTLSQNVRDQALQLVSETENDVPKIIAKFVDWIQKNITYSPEVGSDKRLTDSQVLILRAGVCDEFSTLFIAFCRATGIPARRVLGYGITSDNYISKNIESTAHSWAEVWIPNHGWLIVDPTWADIGDTRRIAVARKYDERVLTWRCINPSPSLSIDVTYSIILARREIIKTAAPITLIKEETENAWKIIVKNTSSVPLLDNVLVKKSVLKNLENWDWSDWSIVSNEIIFMNPQENYTLRLEKEDGVHYFVWSARAENWISMWQYPGGTSTTPTITPTTTPTPTPTPTATPTATPTPAPADTTWVWVGAIATVAIVIALIAVIVVLRGK